MTVAGSMESGLPPTVEGTVVTVGTFDGVHRGHLDVIRRLVIRAGELGLERLVISRSPLPSAMSPSASSASTIRARVSSPAIT